MTELKLFRLYLASSLSLFGLATIVSCGGGENGGYRYTKQFSCPTSAAKQISTLNNVSTLAGKPGVFGSANGTGSGASFQIPRGVATDGTNLYVADAGNHTIRQIVISTGAVTTLAGTAGTPGAADGIGSVATFNGPLALTLAGTNLYVADGGNNTIRKITVPQGGVATIAGTAGVPGFANGTGTGATLNNPKGVTNDGTSLYVADAGNNVVRRITISTGAVTTLPTNSGFLSPSEITSDGTNLFVVDSGNGTIRKITISSGAESVVYQATPTVPGVNGCGSQPVVAINYGPLGIATDGTYVYFTQNSNAILQVSVLTGATANIAGTGVNGSADGPALAATFNYPTGIATDGTNLYVADTGNGTIRKIY